MLMKTRDELWIIRLKFSEDLILSSTTSLFKRLPKKTVTTQRWKLDSVELVEFDLIWLRVRIKTR